MRKVSRKISWDLDQRLILLSRELKLSVDSSIRYLLEFREKKVKYI